MLKQNLKVFLILLFTVVFFILLKNGQIFDLGLVFRSSLLSEKAMSNLLNPPDDIQEAYKDLLAENNRLKALADENQQLKDLLDFKKEKQYNLLVANVLSRDPVNRNVLILDAGANEGVAIGQAIVVNNGIIVGKVIDVTTDSCEVRLLIDKQTKLGVKIGEEHRISGLLSGSLGLTMELSYIPQNQEVKKNDLVVTADLEAGIPQGLVVGRVEEIEYSEGELFKKASVSPLIDYDTLAIVAIIK
ncbi:rod shape-determining protein MreC [Candidatus Parcubacteria bacterium]|nr:MAG: rod shape-determining protein MreC [Candidatus Parcubacteria bacterium]